MSGTTKTSLIWALGGLVVVAASLGGCLSGGSQSAGSDAANAVYVPPGSYDEFYAFMSGGFSGNVTVHGLPSGRLIKTVPVFSQFPENGWGYSEETKDMLMTSFGFVPWDDSHHPELSQTDGVPDGRWLFINGNNTPRVARISLASSREARVTITPEHPGGLQVALPDAQ